ncbi:LysR substrate-binding domain-containing protein [Rhizobium sp. Root1220]|uniref:LysR substrate-binding domain-containing protein n=1 Tax=Rhizobium sp. Root1220 TaxID=1736432 RepID=UPI0006F4C537|nr:LysR substrate-binding domain-containing protein [Rhizobium sp. Root1220]KQV64587.1 LysR family transcriptional regulator [Rhizobium sp. Root1220]
MKLSKQFPLNALRVFEAVARLGSFTKAGEELGMTQTAVSYQVKLLEENIGELLFLRRPRRIELTDAGARMQPKVTDAFSLLNEAMAEGRGEIQSTLLINTIATYASHWLARRLGSFQLAHPAIAVRLSTSETLVDFTRESVDVAIRSGTGNWRGLLADRLMETDFTPMLSPKLAESVGGIRRPEDLLKLPIIGATDPWWQQWFAAAGLQDLGLEARPRSQYGSQTFEASAAMAGQGVAILTPAFYGDEIAQGRLFQPFEMTCNDGRGYWLVYAEGRRNVPKIKAFRNWILEEINRSDPAGLQYPISGA